MTQLDIIRDSAKQPRQHRTWKVKHFHKCVLIICRHRQLQLILSGSSPSREEQCQNSAAHATVMVGQWAGDPDLIAVEEFETQLAEGWLRKKKRKADIPAEGQAASKVIVVADNSE
ncbi:hypothetical protein DFH09DRAFT_1076236 [Mycena vulgaris]|nr:hypothetical protein DFH09DRAFT_1076236 [Mycena vulgaris]